MLREQGTMPTTQKTTNENGEKAIGEKEFEDGEDGKFKFLYPGNWYINIQEMDGFPGTVMRIFMPSEELSNGFNTLSVKNGIKKMIEIKGIDYSTTLGPSATAENAYENANVGEGKFRETGDEISEITIAETPALKRVSEGMGGVDYVTIAMLKEKFYYQIDYQIPKDSETEAREGIDKILNSFEILDS
jgi:hypothetical protein